MALLAAMVGVFGLLRPEELADHGGHSLWSKCWQFVSLFYCKTSQKLGHLMYTETEDGNRRPGDCFSFCACHVWHWLHLFWGKSNPGVMPVGGICSHWPPFSRMQVSQPVRQTDTVTEARCLMFPCRHIGSYRHFKTKNRNKTIHFAHHLRCGLSGIQFVWWRPRGPLTCKQLHDSSRAKLEAAVGWMQMMPFSMEQVVRYHSFLERLGFSILELKRLVLDWPRLHFLHCVAIDYVCCGCMQEMNTKCVHIKLIKLIKRFVLESWSFLYSIASHASRFKPIPSPT